MPTTAQSIIKAASTILKDLTCVRWPAAELVVWLNDAQWDLALFKPDACAVTETLALVAGFRQQLPVTVASLIDITNNATGERRPIRQISRSELDDLMPTWRSATPSLVVKHFMHDLRTPLTFDVDPPAAVGASVDVVFSKYPADVAVPGANTTWADVVGNVNVPDIYANALLDYVLYRAFSKDSELTVNAARAQTHYQAFAAAIGIKVAANKSVSPKSSEPGGSAS